MQSKRAFSLIETMLAILILGTGLVGLSHGIAAALRASKESELQTKAALFAEGKMETLRAEPFILEGQTDGDCGAGLDAFGWRQSIKQGSIEGLFDVEVTVEESETGKTVYALRTLLFDAPITSTQDEPVKRKERPRR